MTGILRHISSSSGEDVEGGEEGVGAATGVGQTDDR